MSRVAELLLAQGAAQARLAEERGQLYGNLAANLGQLPLQVLQAQRQQQLLGLQTQAEQRRGQLADLEIARLRQKQAEQSKLDQVWGADIWDDHGDIDIGKATAVAQQNGFGHLIPQIRDQASKWREQGEKTRLARTQADEAAAKLDDAHRDALGLSAIGVDPATNPGDYQALIGTAAKQGWITPDQANTYLSLPPDAAKQQLQQFIVRSKAASERTKPRERDITKEEIDPLTNQVIRPAQPKAPTNAIEAWMQSYPGTLHPDRPGITWRDLTPLEQQAGQQAFVRSQADPTAQRQAIALLAQVNQQARQQAFIEAQAGRKELTEKVETPYQTALTSSNTLRDVVAAAQAGNKVAGSLQSLETTMSAIRAQGLNRINTAEIGVTANAGSLWDRLQGWFGKAEAGQPVPKDIQKDMLQFADILDKAAYKKYRTGHQAITKRYGLTDEVPLPAPFESDEVRAVTPAASHTPTLNPRIPNFD